MKKSLVYILVAVVVFSSCKKEDDLKGVPSPVTRMNDTLAKYQKILTAAPYGWKAIVAPHGLPHGVFGFYFKFTDSSRVQMFSDIDSASAVTMKESSYRMAGYNQPTLVFDTYNYLHVLADPDPAVNGGVEGQGFSSDFEFSIDGLVGDTLKLTGRANKSIATLVKATKEEADAYYNKTYGKRNLKYFANMLTYFKRFAYNNIAYDVAIDFTTHSISFTSIDGTGAPKITTTGFYYTPTGINFSPIFNDGNAAINGFDNITWNGTSRSLNFTVNNASAAVTRMIVPVWVDKTAPATWETAGIWLSGNGFHKDGIDDAFGVNNIPNYSFLAYYPKPNGTASTFDAMVAFYDEAQSLFGNAISFPTYTTDGRIIFKNAGTLTAPSPSDDATAIFNNTIAQLLITRGYYLVQTSSTTYDMVSADNGRAWISWQLN